MEPIDHNMKKIIQEKIAHCRKNLVFMEGMEGTEGPTVAKYRTQLIIYKTMLFMEKELKKLVET